MPELEEVGERATGQVSRGQNLVYTLPHTTESIAEFLTPALARVDPAAGGTQVVVVTRDAETALTISETVLRLSGSAGIEVVPVTSAARAGRIFKSRPVLAVAGTRIRAWRVWFAHHSSSSTRFAPWSWPGSMTFSTMDPNPSPRSKRYLASSARPYESSSRAS